MAEGTLTVGVLSPLLAGAYFGETLKGVARELAIVGGRVIAVQTRDARMAETVVWPGPEMPVPLAWDRVSGIVSLTNAVSDAYLAEVQAHGIPLVRVSGHGAGVACPEVVPDNFQGVREAVDHLVTHGHTAIAFAGQMERPTGDDVHERHRAYRRAMLAHGLRPLASWLFSAPYNLEEGGEAVAADMVRAGLPCTAVVAATDIVALGLLAGLRRAGVQVPGQVAVTGFDDREFSHGTTPSLSSVRLDFEEVGRQAARLVLAAVRGDDVAAGPHRVPTSFVARQSCGCPGMTLAPSSGDGGQSPDARIRRDLATRLATAAGPEKLRLAERVAEQVGRCCRDAVTALDPDLRAVADAAEATYRAFPRASTVTLVIECVQQFRRDVLREEGFSEDKLLALDRCTLQVSHALNAVDTRRQVEVNRSLQELLREEHNVSLSLASPAEDTARAASLTWLEGTHARAACLALWSEGDPGGDQGAHLEVAGIYAPGGQELLGVGERLQARSFPPMSALTTGSCGPEDIVMVLPVRTPKRYWGLLAVTGETESVSWAGADVYFQWTALLATTLDRDALLEEVRASEERYMLAAQAASDGLWDWDMTRGAVFYSRRWKAMLGYREEEVGTGPAEMFSRVHPDEHDDLDELVGACLRGERAAFQTEARVRKKDGGYRWMLWRAVAVGQPGQSPHRMVGSLTDITERKELEAQLRRAALYDPLTGLPNRSLFMEHMGRAFARARRSPGHEFCVLFIDLDGFKAVNDRWGHAMGDALLTKVAARLKAHLRDNDTAVRFGGDEFAVLVDGITSDDMASAIVERLHEQLSVPYQIDGTQVTVSATIGIASSATPYQTPEEMVREADTAMYRSKRAERRSRPQRPGPAGTLADATTT
jgi:diguanylate cyclase (GGDEF)-like protein/PAS domain S-box-containing protein